MVDVSSVAVEHDDRSFEYGFLDCRAKEEGGEGLAVRRGYVEGFIVLDTELLGRWAASFSPRAWRDRSGVDEFAVQYQRESLGDRKLSGLRTFA